jgi:aminoglycoside phosphotransferase (APT) family kinase protein
VVNSLASVASQLGLTPIRTLLAHSDRWVAEARDDEGRRYAIKVAEEDGAFAGDLAGNRILSSTGIPVPEVAAYQEGPPAVVVLGWIDGEPLNISSPVEAQHDVGRILRIVHGLPAGDSFSGQSSIAAWIRGWADQIANWWSTVGGTGSQIGRFQSWLEELTPLLERREGTLTLFDGRPDHFLIRGDQVAGLIDLHDVGSGDPAMDLAVVGLDDDRLIPRVIDGYSSDQREIDDLAVLIPFYLLLRRLAGAEWQQRVGSDTEAERLLKLAGDSLRNRLGGS